ncbi:PCI-domain-containing protein, partial [Ramaria rubella]
LSDLTKSLYDCRYDKFFVALASLEQTHLLPSYVLRPHARWYVREMRIRAYAQLLESYSSLTLKSMSAAFGVNEAFVDNDLSRFISSGRLNCSIDQVNGIVETTRASTKAAQYDTVIKRGDVLLGSLQKLSKVLY